MYFGLSTIALCSAAACLIWGIVRLAGIAKNNWSNHDNVAGLFLLGLALLLHGVFVTGAATWSPREFGSTENAIYEGMNENATKLLFLNGSQFVTPILVPIASQVFLGIGLHDDRRVHDLGSSGSLPGTSRRSVLEPQGTSVCRSELESTRTVGSVEVH
jgi:hypothetical protein